MLVLPAAGCDSQVKRRLFDWDISSSGLDPNELGIPPVLMDWFAPAAQTEEGERDIWDDDDDDGGGGGEYETGGGAGGWDDSDDDGFDSFEKKKEEATRSALLNTESELYRVSSELYAASQRRQRGDGDVAEMKLDEPDDRARQDDEYDQRAAMARWYSEQERASKPPFEEWANSFLFLRVEGKKIDLSRSGGGGERGGELDTEEEEEEEEEEIIAIHSDRADEEKEEGGGGGGGGETRGEEKANASCPIHGATINAINSFLANELMNVLFSELATNGPELATNGELGSREDARMDCENKEGIGWTGVELLGSKK